jgi:hypothetical protein
MRSRVFQVLVLAAIALMASVPAYCDGLTDPSTLQFGAVPPNTTLDPVQISAGDFTVNQISNGAETIANLVIFFAVPNVNTGTPISGLSIISGAGTLGSVTFTGDTLTSPPSPASCDDVYGCVGITGANNSNSFVNISGAESSILGITATEFGIYSVTITGANLGGQGVLELGGTMPIGTYMDAYGTGTTKLYDTPFTEAGLNVPEPGSLTLLGAGLGAVAAAMLLKAKA